MLDCILLGAILCNVDLVATMSVMSPSETPQLYSILFGEVIRAIVLEDCLCLLHGLWVMPPSETPQLYSIPFGH